jgi:PAS domain-containing protein
MALGGAAGAVLLAVLLGLVFVLLHRTDSGIRAQQAELRESHQRYELVIEGAGGAIWDWDVSHQRVHYSSRWKALRGYEDDEISDSETEWIRTIHPDDAPQEAKADTLNFLGWWPAGPRRYSLAHGKSRNFQFK